MAGLSRKTLDFRGRLNSDSLLRWTKGEGNCFQLLVQEKRNHNILNNEISTMLDNCWLQHKKQVHKVCSNKWWKFHLFPLCLSQIQIFLNILHIWNHKCKGHSMEYIRNTWKMVQTFRSNIQYNVHSLNYMKLITYFTSLKTESTKLSSLINTYFHI